MAEITFRFTSDGSVFTDEASLVQPLARVLGQVLRIDRIPSSIPLVGHCPVVDRWCVFARDADQPDVRGVVLTADAYAEVGFDPFVAGAAHLRTAGLTAAVRVGPSEPATFPCEARGLSDALRTAYGCFLAGDPKLRQGPYVSVLPAGLAPEISPLTCLVAADLGGTFESHEEVFPGNVAGEPDQPSNRSATEHSWHSLALERGGDAAAPAPPSPPRPAADTGRDLEHRLAALEARLARTRWMLAGGLALALFAGLAGGVVLATRLQRLEASTVRTATLANGLGIEAGAHAEAETIEAHLHDLATVAVQSGAWQAGLRRRGVEPARFLDRLVDIAQAHDRLLGLAGDSTPIRHLAAQAESLTALAPRSANLLTLAAQEESLTDLASRRDALDRLAERRDPLDALAAAAKALMGLAANAPQVNDLARRKDELVSLARQQSALDSLAARATPLRTLADQGADLMVFWERYQRPLEALAQRQASLEELVKRQRTLERLVESGPKLFELADSDPLLRLVKRPADLRALADDLDDVLALADHRSQLIGGPPPVPGRSTTSRLPSSG